MPMQFSLRKLLITTALAATCFALIVAWHHSIMGRVRYARRLESHIESLRGRRPSQLTISQWDCMVDWTRNLHGNSLIAFQTSTPQLAKFEARVAARLAGNVDANTIEWLWDEYAGVCPGGQNYQRFRLMVNDSLAALNSPSRLDPPDLPTD
ncbi:hypothetical protein [Roseiconus lacunae]|uniref:Uncharacterized protein n=2 Tax=Roseiconus lacunae TaxID=2605694 RepID=A0ABT7PKI2_9BACT|nr:hypothetical protein [Roseiconus lacunae]MDM4016811.1 hypothetical protein [Roseiconus lacunae]